MMSDVAGAARQASLRIVTVHGTNAGDPENLSGERWWQLGSAFQTALGKLVDLEDSKVEIVPFQWEKGPNSELSRRKAGADLLKLLRGYDGAGLDYCLIGHSHGGSVIYSTLLQSVDTSNRLERLRAWITIGTPFLDYRANRFIWQRLSGLGLTIYSTGIVALVVALAYWISARPEQLDVMAFLDPGRYSQSALPILQQLDVPAMLHNLAVALSIYAAGCFITIFLLERRKKGWFTLAEKRQVEALYGDRWLGLWHQQDEAISALLNVRSVWFKVIPNSFLQRGVGYLILLLVFFIGLVMVLDVLSGDGQIYFDTAYLVSGPIEYYDATTDTVDLEHMDQDWVLSTVLMMMLLAFFGVLTWIVAVLLRLFAGIIGVPLAYLSNKVIWSFTRKQAWGDDLVAEDVYNIAPYPPEFKKSFGYLPEVIAEPLREHSDGHAITTLNKVRRLLGMAEGSVVQPDMRVGLGDTLNWQELIHTSYFEVPQFVDLLALYLEQRGLVRSRDAGLTEPATRAALTAWLAEQGVGAAPSAG